MAIEVTHRGHTYTYRHLVGWSGGDAGVREKLNEHCPASEYPAGEAEEAAVRHALGGILAGGEAVETASGKHLSGGPADLEGQEPSAGGQCARADRILDETDKQGLPAGDPDRILQDSDEQGESPSDPDKILED